MAPYAGDSMCPAHLGIGLAQCQVSTYTPGMAPSIPQRPAIYCRLSYTENGDEEKVDRQEEDTRALFRRLGWPQPAFEHVFKDNNRSAWQRNRKRPDWDRMLALVEAGEIDGIGVYHGDRLIRQPWDLELLLRIAEQKHLPLASPTGIRDLSSEDDRFILRIEAAQACKASADTSRRVRRGWEARAKEGRPSGGGRRPFGFENDFITLRESEAKILAEAAERLLAGESQGAVLRWMNGISTTTQGNRWQGHPLRHLLRSPRIAGLVEHNGTLYKAVWDPIISRQQWEDLKILMEQSSRDHPYPGRERRYLLTGVAECYKCGVGLRAKPSGGRNRKSARLYCCMNRDCTVGVGRNVDHLDAYVIGRVLRLLNDSEFVESIYAENRGDEQSNIAAEIVSLERRKAATKETLRNLADHPGVDAALLAESLASFDRKMQQLRDARSATAQQRLLARMAGITREKWDVVPLDVRAETVRILYRIIVLPVKRPGPGFDPDCVTMLRRSLQAE